eukprot:CAMPEP_0202969412 /NCGR_PEP_ID=MMETSP1396-20130829/15128_1 /ASSEMBLY_ACC=CAM_ASM_000872 /TAXON_ID= /ORGANISM="Pseudokeronopsis sp., Strain Brazil" /LENGTH=81 /DNA_ID=CAMNT_0049696907 /DNA_START=28 /DNA_END=269 /DNA_ORIENTATION=+
MMKLSPNLGPEENNSVVCINTESLNEPRIKNKEEFRLCGLDAIADAANYLDFDGDSNDRSLVEEGAYRVKYPLFTSSYNAS